MEIFNNSLLINKKNACSAKFEQYNFLRLEVTSRLLERIDDIKINFPKMLDINCCFGEVASLLQNNPKIGQITQIDQSPAMLQQNIFDHKIEMGIESLNFNPNSFDLVTCVWGLHNVNDLQGSFNKIHKILKKGGLLMLSTPIIGTLGNLEQALMQTELQLKNRFSPRIHPFSDIKTLGNLCQGAGFSEIIADKDHIQIMYKDFFKIFKDLKGMGETNILQKQNYEILPKRFFEVLKSNFSANKNNDHYVIDIHFCNILAWKV